MVVVDKEMNNWGGEQSRYCIVAINQIQQIAVRCEWDDAIHMYFLITVLYIM